NWRVKLEVVYYTCTFFWFNAAIVLSNIIFASNLIALVVRQFNDEVTLPFTFNGSNLYLEQMLFFNWLLMILIYLLQIHLAMAT
ncbi:glycosyltransferase family 2 protein, partial [Streptococcus suis]